MRVLEHATLSKVAGSLLSLAKMICNFTQDFFFVVFGSRESGESLLFHVTHLGLQGKDTLEKTSRT